jgi:flagellar biosynthesis protein FlhB
MSGARTEQPTPRRLREARRRGEVARSADLTAAAALGGGLAGLAAWGPGIAETLGRAIRAAAAGPAATAEPAALLREAAALVLRLALPTASCALAAALVAGALQTGWVFAPGALRPRLERIDPLRGLSRLLSIDQAVRAGLGVAKAAVLVALLAAWARAHGGRLAALPRAAAPGVLPAALPALAGLALRLAGALALLGLLDLALERRRLLRALRMTRDEVRREIREDEGDPAHRSERRRAHRAVLEAGPLARATVVVVNPTHVAVALRHEEDGEGAPRVVAKGTGLAAWRIRSAARRGGVPVVRDVPLARALHRLADVGDEIPEELYDAAAALLAHLYAAPEAR